MDLLSALSSRRPSSLIGTLLACLAIILLSRRLIRLRHSRSLKVPYNQERVVILGASGGIGRAIAHKYAARGARVCVIGRREVELAKVVEECRAFHLSHNTGAIRAGGSTIFSVAADFTNVEDMVHIRSTVEAEWKGLDTLIVCAGVSALCPLMEVAGLERHGQTFTPAQATMEGIQRTVNVTNAAVKGNYVGPLVSAVTFIPLLASASASPSILLVSSLAAVIPPPTRSLYASTKAASLMLYQVLAIEHPEIAFTHFIPSTVEGDFRTSAVDSGRVREAEPNKHGLKREAVARRCVEAVDEGERMVFMPVILGRGGQIGQLFFPAVVEWIARRKYRFSAI
ncbi:11-beta-hydroxysteroid dehydrogenase-like 2 [Grifola frondosa]|uniref:11-beta-hydroxysteroid dehydrogenase-like 2 n=1 Tax=Grifola frondosa TaxID=5627 RepID=A0A1C7M5T4_GRIFR|nr:11-beta-hydroxysteroid dehydrogenase-like 2 [Grifola frondosa]